MFYHIVDVFISYTPLCCIHIRFKKAYSSHITSMFLQHVTPFLNQSFMVGQMTLRAAGDETESRSKNTYINSHCLQKKLSWFGVVDKITAKLL